MTINIADRHELLSQLVGQMGQGGTAGNFANYYGGLEPPKQSDIAAFRAAAQPSDLQVSGDTKQPGSLVDGTGNTKATAVLPEIYNAGNAQQADSTGKNVPGQQGDNNVDKSDKAEKGQAGSAEDKARMAELDDERKKQGEISSLISRIQQLQQQLQVIDSRGGASIGGQSSSLGDGFEQTVSKSSPERTALVSLIQQLQQQLQVLQSS